MDQEYDTWVTGHRGPDGKVIPPRKIRCPECGKEIRLHGRTYRCPCGTETTLPKEIGK